ncbi:MAG: riboflavin synthase subunit alpha [Candidatus Aminicenantes bacterium RBG_19FT_COMBO_65_30]|nr:MAG: riboflavin synthase subunit alpha [Candidatus Aminicenantes bacterium RBG_19FT_COMBO_65_30]
MFTGIISNRGTFRGYRQGRKELLVEAPGLAAKLATGDSLAVNGVCLSLVAADRGELRFNLSRETIERTTLGGIKPGGWLNLELPLTLASPLSGHLVSGHVDGVGKVLRATSRPPGKRLTVSFPTALRPFLVPKGSVAVDGVSLTVASLGPSTFEVELIPLTLEGTNLGGLRGGAFVNLECDMVGKYVYNWLSQGRKAG